MFEVGAACLRQGFSVRCQNGGSWELGVGLVKVYGPTDAWPNHPKPWFRDVYKLARGYGWSLKPNTAHQGSARLHCPDGLCEFLVFATGRSSEAAAKQARRLVERCSHRAGLGDSLIQATGLLDSAERLLGALDARREIAALNQQAENLLVGSVADEDEEILELWGEAERLTAEAESLLEGADPDRVVAEVDSSLCGARELLRPLPQSEDVELQRCRARQLRGRLNDHR